MGSERCKARACEREGVEHGPEGEGDIGGEEVGEGSAETEEWGDCGRC